jgi:ATP-dependent Lhr-like helicase
MEVVKDRLLIPEGEWLHLNEAIERDGADREEGLLDAILQASDARLARLSGDVSSESLVVARESVPRLLELLSLRGTPWTATDLSLRPIESPPAEPVEDGHAAWLSALGQWLSFYGPLPAKRVCELFVLSETRWERLRDDLVQSEQVVWDVLSEGSASPEVCDVTNLEILLRMLRRSRQPTFQARPLEALPAFLAAHQGVGGAGESAQDLQQILTQLFGLALKPQLWEEVVFPARLFPYCGSGLDSLVQAHGLLLLGQDEQKLSFAFAEDLELFQVAAPEGPSGAGQDGGLWEKLTIPATGRFSLLDLAQKTGLSTAELTTGL